MRHIRDTILSIMTNKIISETCRTREAIESYRGMIEARIQTGKIDSAQQKDISVRLDCLAYLLEKIDDDLGVIGVQGS